LFGEAGYTSFLRGGRLGGPEYHMENKIILSSDVSLQANHQLNYGLSDNLSIFAKSANLSYHAYSVDRGLSPFHQDMHLSRLCTLETSLTKEKKLTVGNPEGSDLILKILPPTLNLL
jgi:hypothetical protein